MAYKTKGIISPDGSWVLTTNMHDGNILKAVGSSADDWTGILVLNAEFEKRFINSNGVLTVIKLTADQIQQTCITDIDGLWTCEKEENIVGKNNYGDLCIKDFAIHKSRNFSIC